MAELDGTVEETIEDFNGSGYTETEYAFRDFSAKEVAINALMLGLEGGPGGFPDASQVDFTPAGTIAATDVQAALEELDADIQAIEPAEGGGGWPVREYIIGSLTPASESNFDNLAAPSVGWVMRYSDNTNGSWIEWNIALGEGVYAIDCLTLKFDGGGILLFSLDGTSIASAPYNAASASIDTYAGVLADFQIQRVCSDLEIATAGEFLLRATVTGKNGSSTGHQGSLYMVNVQKVDEL